MKDEGEKIMTHKDRIDSYHLAYNFCKQQKQLIRMQRLSMVNGLYLIYDKRIRT